MVYQILISTMYLHFLNFFGEFDDGGVGGVVGLPSASFLYGYFC